MLCAGSRCENGAKLRKWCKANAVSVRKRRRRASKCRFCYVKVRLMGKDAAVVHQKRYFAPHLSQLTDSEQLVRVVLGVTLCARRHAVRSVARGALGRLGSKGWGERVVQGPGHLWDTASEGCAGAALGLADGGGLEVPMVCGRWAGAFASAASYNRGLRYGEGTARPPLPCIPGGSGARCNWRRSAP